jgi:hypothetical protein
VAGLPHTSDELNPDLQAHENALARDLTTEQLHVKDAFLVLRALCKLTMKPLLSERYASADPIWLVVTG